MHTPDLAGATWRKSSRSNAQGECVEVALLPETIAVRDSKNPIGGTLVFTGPAWSGFVHALKTDGRSTLVRGSGCPDVGSGTPRSDRTPATPARTR
ncbi:MAG: DUF397 domain-containing protein [Micromonosporaceae bacterium]|nr:DUF397 domain-containing protein [Micromonosporaceae bacterium]